MEIETAVRFLYLIRSSIGYVDVPPEKRSTSRVSVQVNLGLFPPGSSRIVIADSPTGGEPFGL